MNDQDDYSDLAESGALTNYIYAKSKINYLDCTSAVFQVIGSRSPPVDYKSLWEQRGERNLQLAAEVGKWRQRSNVAEFTISMLERNGREMKAELDRVRAERDMLARQIAEMTPRPPERGSVFAAIGVHQRQGIR